MTEIARRIDTAKRNAVRQRNYRRARDRALVRLAGSYPETYKELLEQEKVLDVELAKKWFDIDGSTSPAVGVSTARGEQEGSVGPADSQEREGDSE